MLEKTLGNKSGEVTGFVTRERKRENNEHQTDTCTCMILPFFFLKHRNVEFSFFPKKLFVSRLESWFDRTKPSAVKPKQTVLYVELCPVLLLMCACICRCQQQERCWPEQCACYNLFLTTRSLHQLPLSLTREEGRTNSGWWLITGSVLQPPFWAQPMSSGWKIWFSCKRGGKTEKDVWNNTMSNWSYIIWLVIELIWAMFRSRVKLNQLC